MGKKVIRYNRVENAEGKTMFSRIIGYFLLGFLLVFPWITYAVNRGISDKEKAVYLQKIEGVEDNCLFGKMYILLIFAVFLIVCIGLYIIENRQRIFQKNNKGETISIKDVVYAGTALFAVLAMMSAGLSEFTHVSLWGSYNNPEGLFVILSYIVLAVAAYIGFQNNQIWDIFKYIIMGLALITILLSLVEFFYKPITQILYPEGWTSDYKNMVSLTFYNSGYYGGFVILLFPLILNLLINAKKLYGIVLLVFESVGMFICVLLSKSTGAFYVALFEIFVVVIYEMHSCAKYKKYIFKWKTKLIGVLVIFVMISFIDLIGNGKIENQLFSTASNETEGIYRDDYSQITDISVEGNVINITSKNFNKLEKILKVELNGTQIEFSDKVTGQIIDFSQNSETMDFQGDFEGISARIENHALTMNYGYKGDIRFYIYENTFYPMLSDGSIIQDITGSGLKGGDFIHTATGRGYIWMNTLPILKNSIFIGQGPATFGLCFKQFDFVGLLNSQGTVDLFIDKPHNLYLQTAEQTGVVSALIVIVLLFTVISSAIRKQRTRKIIQNNDDIGLLISVFSFAVLGIVNDSCITVNPIFWIMVGILFARTCESIES